MRLFLRNLAYRLLEWTAEPVWVGNVVSRLGLLVRRQDVEP